MASAMSSVLMEQIRRGNDHIEDVLNGRIRQTVQKFIDRIEEHDCDDTAALADSIQSDSDDIANEFDDLIVAESDGNDGGEKQTPPSNDVFMEIQRKMLQNRKKRKQETVVVAAAAVPSSDHDAFVRMQLMNAVLSQCRWVDGEFVVDPSVYDGGVSVVYENALAATDPRHMMRTKSDRFHDEHCEFVHKSRTHSPQFKRWAELLDGIRMPLVHTERGGGDGGTVTYITLEQCGPVAYDRLSGVHTVVQVPTDEFDSAQWLASWHMVNMKFAAQEHFRHRIVTRGLANGVGSVAELVENIFVNHAEIVHELVQMFLQHRDVVKGLVYK